METSGAQSHTLNTCPLQVQLRPITSPGTRPNVQMLALPKGLKELFHRRAAEAAQNPQLPTADGSGGRSTELPDLKRSRGRDLRFQRVGLDCPNWSSSG